MATLLCIYLCFVLAAGTTVYLILQDVKNELWDDHTPEYDQWLAAQQFETRAAEKLLEKQIRTALGKEKTHGFDRA